MVQLFFRLILRNIPSHEIKDLDETPTMAEKEFFFGAEVRLQPL